MLYEYAVDPEITRRDFTALQHLFGLFGLDRGRYISQLPKRDWLRMAYLATEGRPELERARIEILLKRAKASKLFAYGRCYDANLPWLPNTHAAHMVRPFQAIIASDPDPAVPAHVELDVVDEDHELLACSHTCRVPRTAANLAEKLAPLALIGKRLALIDPFLDLRNTRGQDFRAIIRELLSALAAAGREAVTLELHWRSHDSRPPEALVLKNARTWCVGIIPNGFKLELYEWVEREGGEDFHDRFFLTEAGGIMSGAGFEDAGVHEQVQLSLLSSEDAASHLADLDENKGVFDLAFRPVIVESDGAVRTKSK